VLADGFQVKGGASQVIEKVVEKIVTVEKIVEVPVANGHHIQTENEEDMNKEAYQLLQSTIELFKTNQTKSLEIFERFLQEQNQQSQQLLQLLAQQIAGDQTPKNNGNGNGVEVSSSFSNGSSTPTKALEYTNGASHSHKIADTATTTVVATETAAVSAPAPSSGGFDSEKLTSMLLAVVSEKTGYPAEMLELSMDMEADLGIDSIKRVEIFGALTAQYPEVSSIDPNELTELRTLAEIVSHVGEKVGFSTSTVTPAANTAPVVTPAPAPTSPAAVTPGFDAEKLTAMLLAVVSEKTGYPAEMLELSMDMEADLGIDSIKRVEIFGALTAQYPDVSSIDPNELTELRTLAEIVSHVGAKVGGSNSAATAAPAAPVQAAPTVATPAAPSNGPDNTELTNMLLAVVSEKTGYPAEMLELSMDMEADLGIDSIKRVEIFGALTQKYPELSGVDANELTELRTLAEIVDHVSQHSKKKA